MLVNDGRKPTLDDVLNEIAGSTQVPDEHALRAWMTQYPQFAKEIVEFATDWVAMESSGCKDTAPDDDVDLVVNRTMSRVQQLLDDEHAEKISDLSAAIRAAGHNVDSFERDRDRPIDPRFPDLAAHKTRNGPGATRARSRRYFEPPAPLRARIPTSAAEAGNGISLE